MSRKTLGGEKTNKKKTQTAPPVKNAVKRVKKKPLHYAYTDDVFIRIEIFLEFKVGVKRLERRGVIRC